MKKNKPEIKTVQLYDYMECRDYIVKKYKLDDTKFWHKLCDYGMINNPGKFTLSTDMFEGDEYPEVKAFLDKIFEEFGPDKAELEFEVCW